jgi:hypothetical protein
VADDIEFRFVAASIRRAARLQRQYATTFLETAGAERRSIGEQFSELCDRIDQVVDDYEQRHATAADLVARRVILNAARELLAWTRSLQLRRAWLDAAATPPIDLGSLYYLSGLAKAIVRADAELTVVATHEGSYATVVNPFRAPTKPVPPGIVLVALVPHRETRSGLLHPLLVHEIGHGVAMVHGFTETLRDSLRTPAVETLLDDGAANAATHSGRTAYEERAVLDKRLAAWIEEIFCDAVATACLGATYLFSFATEVLPDDVDAAGPKHPPSRQRVRLILEHLDRLGWGTILDAEAPDFMQWVRDMATDTPAPQRSGDDALRAVIDLGGRAIQDAVDTHVTDSAVTPDDDALAHVAALLAQHVPPSQHENGDAINRPTIIAGCWLAALKSRSGNVDGLADAVDSPELGELLPYALELSVIVERWETAV